MEHVSNQELLLMTPLVKNLQIGGWIKPYFGMLESSKLNAPVNESYNFGRKRVVYQSSNFFFSNLLFVMIHC